MTAAETLWALALVGAVMVAIVSVWLRRHR